MAILALAVAFTGGCLQTTGAAASGSLPAFSSSPARAAQTDDANGGEPADELGLSACLLGSWIRSYEDDTDEATAYRPADYPFPPARGRTGYKFLAGGYLVYHGIGPADEPTLSHGRWELFEPAQVRVEVDEPYSPRVVETLKIASCSEDLLEVTI